MDERDEVFLARDYYIFWRFFRGGSVLNRQRSLITTKEYLKLMLNKDRYRFLFSICTLKVYNNRTGKNYIEFPYKSGLYNFSESEFKKIIPHLIFLTIERHFFDQIKRK